MITRKELLAVCVSSALSAAIAIGVEKYRRPVAIPHDGPVDTHFVGVGRSYSHELGKAYAGVIRQGVVELVAGVPVSQAFGDITKTWDAGRQEIFDRLVTPELDKVLPETVADADVTPQQRAALAAAMRGFAQGVER